jgi:hypothetical protein
LGGDWYAIYFALVCGIALPFLLLLGRSRVQRIALRNSGDSGHFT